MSGRARSILLTLLGSPALGPALAKVGTKSDLTLYHHVTEGLAVSYVEPTLYPERFPPLLAALAMGDAVVLAVEKLDRDLAECVVTSDLAGKDRGFVVLGPSVGEAEVRALLKGTQLEGYPFLPWELPRVRTQVEAMEPPPPKGELSIPVDHAFPVKGVGPVVLGVVRGEPVRAHEKLRLFPTEKTVEVRSIQVHDVEVPEASPGDRVGLALKGVEAEELSRGLLLAREGSYAVKDLLEIDQYRPCRFFKGKAGEGDRVHVSLGLSLASAKVQTVDGPRYTLALDKPLAVRPGERALLVQLSGMGAGPRVAGGGLTL